jgi:hypothetical protein
MATVNEDTQSADVKAAETRNQERRDREWATLSDREVSARKAEAKKLTGERDKAMQEGDKRALESIDERLRALNYPEEQSTNVNVIREHARELPFVERRNEVAAGHVPADVLDDSATKGKATK